MWQPIEAKTPTEEREYFLAWDGEMHFAHEWGGHRWSVNQRDPHDGDELPITPTHWMPLPEPPQP